TKTRGTVLNCQPFAPPCGPKCTGRMSGSVPYCQARNTIVAAMASTLSAAAKRVSADSCRKPREMRVTMIVSRSMACRSPCRPNQSMQRPSLRDERGHGLDELAGIDWLERNSLKSAGQQRVVRELRVTSQRERRSVRNRSAETSHLADECESV